MYCILQATIDFLIKSFAKRLALWEILFADKKVNLNSNLVRDFYNKDDIIKTVRCYQLFLLKYTVDLNLALENEYNVVSWVKTRNSIEDKIKRYSSGAYQDGKIPLIKCLNDLFGIRIVLQETLTFEDICNFIQNENSLKNRDVKLKCINSSKKGYKATHIYLKKYNDNSVFPWELQIWSSKHEKDNIRLHKAYKQDYTKWESEIVKEETP